MIVPNGVAREAYKAMTAHAPAAEPGVKARPDLRTSSGGQIPFSASTPGWSRCWCRRVSAAAAALEVRRER